MDALWLIGALILAVFVADRVHDRWALRRARRDAARYLDRRNKRR